MSGQLGISSEAIKQTAAPRQKVIAAAGGSVFGSAASVILLWIFDSAMKAIGITFPPDVANAFTAIVTGLFTFSAGYYMPPSASEAVIKAEDGSLKAATKTG